MLNIKELDAQQFPVKKKKKMGRKLGHARSQAHMLLTLCDYLSA